MRISAPINIQFTECDTCNVKPGSPELCNGCLKNRKIINEVNEFFKKIKEKMI